MKVGDMGVDTLSGFNGNLLSLQTASTTRFKVDQGARVTIGTDTSSGLSQLTVVSTSSASIPLTLQGFSGQLSNLFQIASSSGANLVMISSGGNLTVTGSTTISGVINASGGINLLSILNCNGSGLLETNSSGGIQCGVDDIGSGGSGDTVFDPINGAIRLTTSTVRVGFGTTTPYAKLSIQGNTNGTPSTTVAILPASGQAANILDIYTTAGVLNTVIDSLNRFGLGTTSPGFTLSVAGTLGVTGTSSLQGAEAIFINDTGNLLVGGTVSITGSSTIQGELNVGATSTLSGIQNTGFITTTGNINAQNSITAGATSTFTTGITAGFLTSTGNIFVQGVANLGTTTANAFIGTNTGTSTIAGKLKVNGIILAESGQRVCTASNGACPAGGSGTVSPGTTNRLAYYTGGSTVSSANSFIIDAANGSTTFPILNVGTLTATTGTSFISSLTLGTPLGVSSGGTNASAFSNATLVSFDGTRLIGTSSPSVSFITATSTQATSTFFGGVVANRSLYITDNGDIGGTLGVTGSSTIQGELNVGATSTLSGIQNTGFITTTGNINAQNSITAGATSTFTTGITAGFLTSTGNIFVQGVANLGTTTIAGKLEVNGIILAESGQRVCTASNGACPAGGSGTVSPGTTNRLAYYTGATTLDSATSFVIDALNGSTTFPILNVGTLTA